MKARLILIIALSFLFVACDPIDTLKKGFAHSQAVSDSLEKSVGVKSFVGFNWNNGSLTSVNITFASIPEKVSLTDIVEKSRQAVLAEFKETPGEIIVAFTVKP